MAEPIYNCGFETILAKAKWVKSFSSLNHPKLPPPGFLFLPPLSSLLCSDNVGACDVIHMGQWEIWNYVMIKLTPLSTLAPSQTSDKDRPHLNGSNWLTRRIQSVPKRQYHNAPKPNSWCALLSGWESVFNVFSVFLLCIWSFDIKSNLCLSQWSSSQVRKLQSYWAKLFN